MTASTSAGAPTIPVRYGADGLAPAVVQDLRDGRVLMVGYMDADGYFYFTGRKKERIRRRGENISGYEIERIVSMHPDIAEVAAVAHPAEAGEDDVRCVIIQRAGAKLTAEALMDWLQPRMPFFMLPRYIEFVDDMPRTPSAKVEKYKLVEAGLSSAAWDREKAGYRIERSPPKVSKIAS